MRRPILLYVIVLPGFLFQTATLLALDWGGSISTNNTIQSTAEGTDEEGFVNSERLVLYLSTPIGRRWEFVTQGAATLNSEPVFAADIEKLYLQRTRNFIDDEKYAAGDVEQPANLLEMDALMGRFLLSDVSGLVLTHPVDGIDLVFKSRRSTVSLGAGYTGFINKEFSRVGLSIRDSVEAEDSDVYFGPARLLGRGSVRFPELLYGQNLSAGLAFQQDLRDPDDVVEDGTEEADVEELGGLVDTQYAIVQVDGPLMRGAVNLYYTASYIFNTGRTIGLLEDDAAISGVSYQYAPIRAHLVRGRLRAFFPSFFASAATAGVSFSTGDDDYANMTEGNTAGDANMFTPVTAGGKGAVFGLEPGNSTVSEVSYSLKPLTESGITAWESLQAKVTMYNFFRSSGSGPVSVSDVDPASDGSYLGSEVDLGVNVRPFSDLGLGLTTGFLFGNSSVLFDDANSFDYVVRFNASLSF